MSKNQNSNFAFPSSGSVYTGMTMRDYFAGQALVGELASQSPETGEYEGNLNDNALLAARCYNFADVMLAESEKRKESHEQGHD